MCCARGEGGKQGHSQDGGCPRWAGAPAGHDWSPCLVCVVLVCRCVVSVGLAGLDQGMACVCRVQRSIFRYDTSSSFHFGVPFLEGPQVLFQDIGADKLVENSSKTP